MNSEQILIKLNEMEKELEEYHTENLSLFISVEQLYEMLVWCGGSEDFQEGGKARIGWEKWCIPILERTGELLKHMKEKYNENIIS